MASPQVENGHVDIANEIVEALAHIRLSGEEMQVMWVIFRKTYGWHKKEDAISLGQFSQMTGLTRIHVLRAINKLLPKKVIRVTKNGNNSVNVYEFNKDYEEWVVLPKKVTVTKKGNKVLPIMGTKVLPKKVHTKEKKETKQKKDAPSPEVKIAIDYFFEAVERQKGFKPQIAVKDAALVKKNLKYGIDHIRDQIDFFLSHTKSDEHITLAAAMSADTYNLFMSRKPQRPDDYFMTMEDLPCQ
jgi:phage replication O-like protein O